MNALDSACPVCRSLEGEILHTLDCGNPDGSALYPTVRLRCCSCCGHAFNVLSAAEKQGLVRYYHAEYAPANVKAVGLGGDRPGSEDALTAERYALLHEILAPHIRTGSEILDVGCAMGGFLRSLHRRGYRRLTGVEMTEAYVAEAAKAGLFRIERGEAESLPFEDRAFDVVVMEQVVEHLFFPGRAMQEAGRVLRNGGILLVGVPDAARYADFDYFDFYWLLLREHVQHFDAGRLRLLGEQNGFRMVDHRLSAHAVMGPKMVMPDVYAVFRAEGTADRPPPAIADAQALKLKLREFIEKESRKQSRKQERMLRLARSKRPVYVWGIGREFFYLHASCGLKHCNLVGLIDRNPLKQKTFTVSGRTILEDGVLREADKDSVLLITAFAHADAIALAARALGFPGEFFDLE